MAFKLKSGNKTPFKAMGSTEETNAQYNARVRAEYEEKLQKYNDSTTSYNLQLQKNKLINEADASYGEDSIRNRNQKKVANLTKKQKDLEIYLKNEPTYTMDKAYNYVRNEDNEVTFPERMGKDPDKTRYKTTDASSLKPKELREPTYKIIPPVTPLEILPKKTVEPQPKKSKRKYISKGKTKTNLQTGEVTKVKKQKVKRKTRPGKRKVRNLVTGKNNRIQ